VRLQKFRETSTSEVTSVGLREAVGADPSLAFLFAGISKMFCGVERGERLVGLTGSVAGARNVSK
jgi:hypothetical protein